MSGVSRFKHKICQYILLVSLTSIYSISFSFGSECPSNINQQLYDRDIIVYSSLNDHQIIQSDSQQITLKRDSGIHISYVIKNRDRKPHRAIALLRQTKPSGNFSNTNNVTISNNIWRLLNFIRAYTVSNLDIYNNHHSRSSESQTMLQRLHVPYPNSLTDSFQRIQNPEFFLGFFKDDSKDYWARMHRYRGMRENIICATFILYTKAPPPKGYIDSADFRIIDLAEDTPFARIIDFEVNFGEK